MRRAGEHPATDGRKRTLVLMLTMLLAAACAPACPPGLSVGFNDGEFPPMLLGRGSQFAEPPGWMVEVSRLTLDRLGCAALFVRRPSRRLEAELEQGDIGIALMFGYTEERARRLAFPLDAHGNADASLALVSTRLALYTLPERAAAVGWNGRQIAPGRRVGVVRGTIQDRIARDMDLPTLPYASFDSGLAMLRAGRFDALLINPEVLPASAALRELAPPVRVALYFAAAAPAMARAHGDFLARFWTGICQAMRERHDELPEGCGRPRLR